MNETIPKINTVLLRMKIVGFLWKRLYYCKCEYIKLCFPWFND